MEKGQELNSISYLTFKIGEEKFAAHVSKVQNIVEIVDITEVPQTPDYMLGVINLRGKVLPLIDSRLKLGMPATEVTKDTCIIVCEISIDSEQVMSGFLVDSVEEVLEIEPGNILPAPSIGTKYKSKFIKGIFNVENTFIMLMDLDLIFTSDELMMMSEISGESEK